MTVPSAFISLPSLTGLDAIVAAITHEADYQITRAHEGPHWTRERHARWLVVAWAFLSGGKP